MMRQFGKGLRSPAVKSYLEKSRFRKEVYMIVGIKTATGANSKSTVERERGGELDVALGGTVLTGAPVSVGPVSLRIALESAEPPAQDIAL